ncbi:TPA: hypothetical protein ACUK18_000807 [Escherichia coli]
MFSKLAQSSLKPMF